MADLYRDQLVEWMLLNSRYGLTNDLCLSELSGTSRFDNERFTASGSQECLQQGLDLANCLQNATQDARRVQECTRSILRLCQHESEVMAANVLDLLEKEVASCSRQQCCEGFAEAKQRGKAWHDKDGRGQERNRGPAGALEALVIERYSPAVSHISTHNFKPKIYYVPKKHYAHIDSRLDIILDQTSTKGRHGFATTANQGSYS